MYRRLLKEEYFTLITKITELSTQEGNFATVEFFLSHLTNCMKLKCINELLIDEHESTILHYVAEHNDFKIASYLTENHVNINSKDIWGRSSLYIALKKGNLELAKFLRESCIAEYELLPRAFIETNTKSEVIKAKFSKEGPWLINRVLKEFCTEKEIRKIQNVRDFNVVSCFLLAARYGNSELLQFLLNQENDFDEHDDFIGAEGKAMLIATIYGHFNIVEALLHDINLPSIRDNCGNTVLCLATEFGHSHIVRMLLRSVKLDVDAQKNNGKSSLHIAAKYGHFDIIEYLINAGAKINVQDKNGDSALMVATREGYTNIVKFLLRKKADVSLVNKYKETAIFIAAEYGRSEIVTLLLQMKPDINISNIFDETPLLVSLLHGTDNRRLMIKRNSDLDMSKLDKFYAEDIKIYCGKHLYGFCCSNMNYEGSLKRIIKPENHPYLNTNLNNYKKIVDMLIAQQGDVHRTKIRIAFFAAVKGCHTAALKRFLNQSVHIDVDKPGDTALLMAAKDGKLDVVEMLLQAGVPPNNSNESPLSLAIKYDHNSIVKSLLRHETDIKIEDSNGETALFEACRKGDFHYVYKFRQNGANLNHQNKNGETPLYLAAFHGHFKIVKLLLDKHVDVNKKTWTGENALYVAAFRGYYDIVKILLKRGSQIINQNKKSKIFLLLEVFFNGYYDIAKLLINHGADVNIQDYFGVTPLLLTAKYGLCEITKLLLKQKVDIDVKNFNNETPLIMAAGCGHLDIVKLLVEKKASLNERTRSDETALFVACKNGYLSIVEIILQKCLTDINVPNAVSFTPIFIATDNGHFEIVKLLFSKNANILPNNYEETPLFLAARNGYVEIVEFFLDKGAKVDLVNYEGKTPLFVASENGHLKVVKILLENGANVDTATITKETALFVAVQNQYEDIMKLLLENYADIEIENINGESPYLVGKKLGYDLKKMWCQH